MSGRDLDELGSELRDRILALDEPVSRADWGDVVERSRRGRRRMSVFRRRLAVPLLAVVACSAAAAGGWLLGRSEVPSSTPVVQAAATSWPLAGLVPVSEVSASHGCAFATAQLCVVWHGSEIAGAVAVHGVSAVTIRFTDGSTARVPVSTGLGGGVFLYDVPQQKTVAGVVAGDRGGSSRQVTWYSL